jgi:outer membrane receptor protein involved in Fe transport
MEPVNDDGANGKFPTFAMRRMRRVTVWIAALVWLSGLAHAAAVVTLSGQIQDSSGAVVPGAAVVLRNLATADERRTVSGPDGRYRFDEVRDGTYLVLASLEGFTTDSRSLVVAGAAPPSVDLVLSVGSLSTSVTVTAARGERDIRQVPLHVGTLSKPTLEALAPLSTGDALLAVPGVTPVSSGPFSVRPRLRGLDSTRLLVLVDGERLNNARTATDRAGTEVGLIEPSSIERIEVVNGASSLLYGTDALAGTINIVTNLPRLTDERQFQYGFNGYLSSNEDGRRGTVTLGVSGPQYAVKLVGGIERYGTYRAGSNFAEDTRPLFADGTLSRADTIDDNFTFRFGAFPDPFNAPFVRSSQVIGQSEAEGSNLNVAGVFALGPRQTVRVKYLRRHVSDVGFPDFEPPAFFQRISLPKSDLDKVSARYEVRGLTPWLANVTATAYYQRQARLLRNDFPVQFPAPTPVTFFPINVLRLNILSDTEQRVSTPGLDVQATLTPSANHLVTVGGSYYRDASADRRSTLTQTTLVGSVALGARGPAPIVFPAPLPLGRPVESSPVRVPNASFGDLALFVQDEWRLREELRMTSGVRLDVYRVTTERTPGYEVSSLLVGARPPVDPATLPSIDGERIGRNAFTGDIGLSFWPERSLSPFIRYGRSYRHPNLEELLFSGPATVGAIVPNVQVKPERGDNVDLGLRVRTRSFGGGVFYFNNRYRDFISTEIVTTAAGGPVSQAVNVSDVRIQGVEAEGQAPIVTRAGVVTLAAHGAFTRGTVLEGADPRTGRSLSGTPQDNITPAKVVASVRWTEPKGRLWVEYANRTQAEVTRVAPTLLESPFLIAQDLLSLDGFSVHRLAWGLNWSRGPQRAGVTFALENLTDAFYREHFQFAPARGRSFTVGFHVGAF